MAIGRRPNCLLSKVVVVSQSRAGHVWDMVAPPGPSASPSPESCPELKSKNKDFFTTPNAETMLKFTGLPANYVSQI